MAALKCLHCHLNGVAVSKEKKFENVNLSDLGQRSMNNLDDNVRRMTEAYLSYKLTPVSLRLWWAKKLFGPQIKLKIIMLHKERIDIIGP